MYAASNSRVATAATAADGRVAPLPRSEGQLLWLAVTGPRNKGSNGFAGHRISSLINGHRSVGLRRVNPTSTQSEERPTRSPHHTFDRFPSLARLVGIDIFLSSLIKLMTWTLDLWRMSSATVYCVMPRRRSPDGRGTYREFSLSGDLAFRREANWKNRSNLSEDRSLTGSMPARKQV
jgi:hypothetical protein